jgi:rubrerythrin
MPKANSRDKTKIISEFETMKAFELSARDFYREVAADARVAEPKVRSAFRKLAEDEHRHAELVQEIIDLVEKAL